MRKFVCVSALALLLSSPAYAAVGCEGVVTSAAITPEGDFAVYWGSWNMRVCVFGANITVNRGSSGSTVLTATTCEALYSAFVTALASGKPVIAFLDSSTCTFNNAGNNGVPSPYPYVIHFQK